MFNGRMLKIIQYLKVREEATYKEIAKALNMTERSIRYDVDRINDILSIEKQPLIEKQSKGVLQYPRGLSLKGLEEEQQNVIYTNKERKSIILLILLLKNDQLKINLLSERFQVSRSTIKNDLAALNQELMQEGLHIAYEKHFYLAGPRKKRIILLNREFKNYIYYLINPFTNYNSYEFCCIHIIHMAFKGISIAHVVIAVNQLLEDLDCTLATESYSWYMSNIMVLIWFILHEKGYPLDTELHSEAELYHFQAFQTFSATLAGILGVPVEEDYVRQMARLFDYTNKFGGIAGDIDLIYGESVTVSLIEALSRKLELPFNRDKTLMEGLLNHMIPLIQRIKNKIMLQDNMKLLLGEEEQQLFLAVSEVCRDIESLCELCNEDELTYLTICFAGSIRRMKHLPFKKILLVCGHGYGTTMMLKESLLNQYQIHIIDTIPLYKLTAYQEWGMVDYVLTTIKIHNQLPKPCVFVNPILRQDDQMALERLGIQRKSMLPNYYAIEEKLGFLDGDTRRRVMEVFQKELGYQNMKYGRQPREFSRLLKYDCITTADTVLDWKQAVELCAAPLLERNMITEAYVREMIHFLVQHDFYAVADDSFALIHGQGNEGVYETGISLLVSQYPVDFNGKQVKIIFCLASKDRKEHIPAVVTLMRMVKTTALVQKLEGTLSLGEIHHIILSCEDEAI